MSEWLCPVCRSISHRVFKKLGYWVRECDVCRHRYAELKTSPGHVHKVYGDRYFEGEGEGYVNYLSQAKALISYGKHYAKRLEQYMSPGKILDVGSAAGFILKGFVNYGWEGTGLEPNLNMADYARKQYGLEVKMCPLEQCQDDKQYDLISMIQVISHFYDLRKALQVAERMTRPGCFWLIETWNRESLMARILGKHWHEYNPPSVLHWFSLVGLKQLAEQFGFYEVARGRPSKRLNIARIKAFLRYSYKNSYIMKAFSPMLSFLPNNLTLAYPAYDAFWILLRKSVS